jgi:hypothetical protein
MYGPCPDAVDGVDYIRFKDWRELRGSGIEGDEGFMPMLRRAWAATAGCPILRELLSGVIPAPAHAVGLLGPVRGVIVELAEAGTRKSSVELRYRRAMRVVDRTARFSLPSTLDTVNEKAAAAQLRALAEISDWRRCRAAANALRSIEDAVYAPIAWAVNSGRIAVETMGSRPAPRSIDDMEAAVSFALSAMQRGLAWREAVDALREAARMQEA